MIVIMNLPFEGSVDDLVDKNGEMLEDSVVEGQ